MLHTKALFEKGILLNRKMLTQSQFSQIQFEGILNNYSTLYNVTKAINFVDKSTVQLTSEGMKIVVEEAKCIQTTAYITKACFSEYKLAQTTRKTNDANTDAEEDEPFTTFGLNLKVLKDCLSLFQGGECDSGLKMLYKGEGAPLIMIMEQHGEDEFVTECSIKTMDALEILEYDCEDEHVCGRVNINAQEFFALLNDIDRSCEEIELVLSPNSPHMKLTMFGELHSESNIEIMRSSEIFISFMCIKSTTNRYKFAHFRLMMRSLALASKIILVTSRYTIFIALTKFNEDEVPYKTNLIGFGADGANIMKFCRTTLINFSACRAAANKSLAFKL